MNWIRAAVWTYRVSRADQIRNTVQLERWRMLADAFEGQDTAGMSRALKAVTGTMEWQLQTLALAVADLWDPR